jgi:hypothetical protein
MMTQKVERKVERDPSEMVQVNYKIPRWVHEGIKARADKTGYKLHRFVAIVLGGYLTKEGK